MNRLQEWVAPLSIGFVMFVVMFLGLHGAACNMHVAAVDMLDQRRQSDWAWSYKYCRVVGAPLKALLNSER